MTQTEWIISLDDDLKDYEELFVGNVRDGDRLIRCKDCKYWQDNNGGYPNDGCKWNESETPDPDDYCSGAERAEE